MVFCYTSSIKNYWNFMKRLTKCSVIFLFMFAVSFGVWVGPAYFRLLGAKKAIAEGGFPSQYGITGVTVTPCVVSCYPAENCCSGGTLCVQDVAPACLSSDVMGKAAGGDGNNVLMKKTMVSSIGLSSGGQLIAGGTDNMNLSVAASEGGAVGMVAFKMVALTEKAQGFFGSLISKLL